MAQIPKPVAYRVNLMEYERGWGVKIDETIYFDNEAEARKYCEDFNAKSINPTVPDWYMIAEYCGPV